MGKAHYFTRGVCAILECSAVILICVGAAHASSTMVNAANGKCIADGGYSTALYNPFIQWDCDRGSDDNYQITANSDGSYTFKNLASGLCMDDLGWSKNDGAQIGQYTCDGHSNQDFKGVAVGSGFELKNVYSGLCLSIPNNNNANGAKLVQEPCGQSGEVFEVGISGSSSGSSSGGSSSQSCPSGKVWYPAANACASVISNIDDSTVWKATADASTPASGWTGLGGNPSLDGQSREFYMTGPSSTALDERYSVNVGQDSSLDHYAYDAYVYLANPSATKNLELDVNQTLPNGDVIILGFQCSGYSNRWEYTVNSGGTDKWVQSNAACNPSNWAANTWHHVQIGTHRDSNGNAYYDWVILDGIKQNIGVTHYDEFPLRWGANVIVLNYQTDGYTGSDSFVDRMSLYRW